MTTPDHQLPVSVQALPHHASLTLLLFLKLNFRPPLSSAAHINRCLKQRFISVNGAVQSSQLYRICPDDVVTLTASSFDIDVTRFILPPLNLLLHHPNLFVVFQKPPGMPTKGHQPDSLTSALPPSLAASLPRSHLPPTELCPISGVGRSSTGPVLVSLAPAARNYFQSHLSTGTFRFTYRALVHGEPPPTFGSDFPGLISFHVLATTPSTSGPLSHVQFVTTFGDEGVRRLFFDAKFPVIGNGALMRSSKVSSHGVFMSCISLLFPNPSPTPVSGQSVLEVCLPLAPKFGHHLNQERRFFDERAEREKKRSLLSARLRVTFTVMLAKQQSISAGDGVDLLAAIDADFLVFCDLPLFFTRAVMAPRISSEILVRSACSVARSIFGIDGGWKKKPRREEEGNSSADIAKGECDCGCHHKPSSLRVLDIGVGSGALLVGVMKSLEGEFPGISGVGVDISPDALKVAKLNVLAHGLRGCVDLTEDDFFRQNFLSHAQSLSGELGFHLIVCNPPYLTEGEIKRETNDLRGPDVALTSKDCEDDRLDKRWRKGLGCYEAIARTLATSGEKSILSEGGRVVLELGKKRSEAGVQRLFGLNGLVLESTALDSSNHSRCLVFQRQHCCAC